MTSFPTIALVSCITQLKTPRLFGNTEHLSKRHSLQSYFLLGFSKTYKQIWVDADCLTLGGGGSGEGASAPES